jgi:hypothetical protein
MNFYRYININKFLILRWTSGKHCEPSGHLDRTPQTFMQKKNGSYNGKSCMRCLHLTLLYLPLPNKMPTLSCDVRCSSFSKGWYNCHLTLMGLNWCNIWIRYKCRFLQEPHGLTSQKSALFIVTTVKSSNLTWCNICLILTDLVQTFGVHLAIFLLNVHVIE